MVKYLTVVQTILSSAKIIVYIEHNLHNSFLAYYSSQYDKDDKVMYDKKSNINSLNHIPCLHVQWAM